MFQNIIKNGIKLSPINKTGYIYVTPKNVVNPFNKDPYSLVMFSRVHRRTEFSKNV